MPKTLSPKRFWLTYFSIGLLFCLVVYQLFQLTVVRREALLQIANRQHILRIENAPLRGQIVDRQGREFATNLKVPSVYAVPRMLGKNDREPMVQKLHEILGLSKEFLRERLSRDKAFIWLKRRVRAETGEKIKNLGSPALGIIDETRRFYPQGDLLSQVVGFVNIDNVGLEGVELVADKELKGSAGERLTKRDALGREIRAFEMKSIPTIDGSKVVLTIDQYIQYLAERALERAFVKWKAKGGWALVMNPHTGEILAMVSRPTYDLNRVGQSTADTRRNRTITDMYEPGSIFKIVAASAVLNEGLATTDTEFFCENGEYPYAGGRFTLHDVHPYGNLSLENIVVKSSNIGTVKVAALMEPDVFQKYIESYGFGKKTGIDLTGEARGFTNPPERWSKTSPYNIPIGHEIMVTAIQMATAMSVIANGGNLVQPYVMSRIEDQAGVVLKKKRPKVKHRVIKEEVAETMRGILGRVVSEGTGKRAKIEGISVGGKTGTAQKTLPNGKGYSHSDFMSSFVGFAPVENPMLVMVVTLDDPGPKYYGGTVAAPVFKEVMEPALLSMGYIPEVSDQN